MGNFSERYSELRKIYDELQNKYSEENDSIAKKIDNFRENLKNGKIDMKSTEKNNIFSNFSKFSDEFNKNILEKSELFCDWLRYITHNKTICIEFEGCLYFICCLGNILYLFNNNEIKKIINEWELPNFILFDSAYEEYFLSKDEKATLYRNILFFYGMNLEEQTSPSDNDEIRIDLSKIPFPTNDFCTALIIQNLCHG